MDVLRSADETDARHSKTVGVERLLRRRDERGMIGQAEIVIRAEIDERTEKIGKKIRDTELAKIPYMLVIGEKEVNEEKVSVRRQGKGDLGSKSIEDFIKEAQAEIKERT